MPTDPYRHSAEDEGPGPIGYLALVLAWAVPGLGHFLLGQRARGLVFGITLHLLFAAGLILGGLHSINPPEQPIWTYTQFLAGWPMLVVNHMEREFDSPPNASPRQALLNQYTGQRPGPVPSPANIDFAKKFFSANPLITYHPKVQDIGAVYCGIAGMLNLLVMFDVLLRITGSVRENPNAPKPGSATAPVTEAT